MNRAQLIEAVLQAACIEGGVAQLHPLSGGCIHDVMHVELANGASVVAKIASASRAELLEEERDDLAALRATQTVLVPAPLALVRRETASVLLTIFLQPGNANDETWHAFGEDLARLHNHPVGDRYGFHAANHLGSTPQPNDWHDDWVEFNRSCRLGHQLALARRKDLLSANEALRIERVIENLDQLIPRTPKPALLHGDLWSGNALSTVDDAGRARIAIIDPACSIGDGYADIAMMQLFGGFSRACFEAYEASVSDHAQLDTRIGVYQLYHLLNHVNIFGRGYAGQAMTLADRLVP
jgi:protein-ribulosamine 3-kinase